MADDPTADDDRHIAESEHQTEHRATEHRVGDIVSGRVPQNELDPNTIAQLASWFGAPAQSIVETERAIARGQADPAARRPGARPPADPDDDGADHPDDRKHTDPEIRALWRRRRRAMAAVDPAFLAYFESLTTRGDDHLRIPEPPELAIETSIARFDIEAWRLNFLEIREWEIDEYLHDEMRERTPQALLRDLHRPVTEWPLALEPVDLGVDVGGLKALESIHGIMRARYGLDMEEHRLASIQGREQLDELQERLAAPWEDSYIPESERKSSKISAEDFKWFNSIGYDPFA